MDRSGLGGLAMSRSLGDLCLRPFVSSQPELVERQLGEKDKVLILGSDGVWDHITSQEAVNIASRHKDPSAAARELTRVAQRRWQTETQGMMADDITAVVVNFEHGPPEVAHAHIAGSGSTPALPVPVDRRRGGMHDAPRTPATPAHRGGVDHLSNTISGQRGMMQDAPRTPATPAQRGGMDHLSNTISGQRGMRAFGVGGSLPNASANRRLGGRTPLTASSRPTSEGHSLSLTGDRFGDHRQRRNKSESRLDQPFRRTFGDMSNHLLPPTQALGSFASRPSAAVWQTGSTYAKNQLGLGTRNPVQFCWLQVKG